MPELYTLPNGETRTTCGAHRTVGYYISGHLFGETRLGLPRVRCRHGLARVGRRDRGPPQGPGVGVTTLGSPLVAMTDVALCDRAAHKVVIVTDGQRAYVYPLDDRTQVAGDTAVARVGVTLTAACPCHGDCDGQLVWRLDAAGVWGADGDAMRLLTAYGIGVEQ